MLLIFEKEKKNDFSKNYFFLNRGDPYDHFLKKVFSPLLVQYLANWDKN